jgi:hypothetical protein
VVEPINLNRARKARAAAEAKRQAAENRVKHGRSGAQKQAARLESERAKRRLDETKRED